MKAVEALAKEFAAKAIPLWKERKKAKVKALCKKEIQMLEKTYSPTTIVKNCVKIYRQAMREYMGVEEFKLDYKQEPLSLFNVEQKLKFEVTQGTRRTVLKQHESPVLITHDAVNELLETAERLLKTPASNAQDIYNKATALMLLTGRRAYAEILNHAEFTTVDNYHVSFIGQAKGGIEKRNTAYTIPVLQVKADEIVAAQQEVTAYIKARPWYSDTLTDQELTGKCKKQVQLCIMQFFEPILSDARKYLKEIGEPAFDLLHPHDLRKLAAAINHWKEASKRANPESLDFEVFAAGYLGHYATSTNEEELKDTRTSASYKKFKVVERYHDNLETT